MFKVFLLMIIAAVVFVITYLYVKNKVIEINKNQKDLNNEYPPKFFGCVFGFCFVGLFYILVILFF